jgi:hypothetical protein
MKKLLLFLVLSSLAYPSCYFDSGFQRTICLNQSNTTPQTSGIDAHSLAMAISFKAQNMTPFKAQKQYNDFMAKQTGLVFEASIPSKNSSHTGNSSGLNPVSTNATGTIGNASIKTPTIGKCQNDWETQDWLAFCSGLSKEMGGIDCICDKCTGIVKTNWQTQKDDYKKILGEIHGCYYG